MSDDHLVKNQGNLTINKSFFLATNHSACINFCPQSVSQSAMQSVSQPVSQPVSQLVSQPASQSVNKPVS